MWIQGEKSSKLLVQQRYFQVKKDSFTDWSFSCRTINCLYRRRAGAEETRMWLLNEVLLINDPAHLITKTRVQVPALDLTEEEETE